jgi:hypothetical protein
MGVLIALTRLLRARRQRPRAEQRDELAPFHSITCPFRKSYPDVMVVQPGQDWDGDNDTGTLHRPT